MRAIPLILLLSIGASDVHAADLRIVVHVANHATVAMADLHEAQRQVIAVYRDAGVVVDFTTTPRPTLAFDLAQHVDLVVLSDAMLAMEVRSGYVTAKVVGNASRALMRAYIYYKHLANHATDTRSPISRALGIAISHEIAHLLLPRHSHSTNGIMQAQLTGRVTRVPRFTAPQAAAMRGFLNQAAQGVRDRLANAPPESTGTPSVGAGGAVDLRGALAARDINDDLRVR